MAVAWDPWLKLNNSFQRDLVEKVVRSLGLGGLSRCVGALAHLFILRMHCCDAFSLSQSVLRVGSQEVAWIWDSRPPPATPNPTPGTGEDACAMGDTATTGGEEAGVKVSPKPAAVGVTAATGATKAVRPLCATAAGGKEAEEVLG